MVTDLLSTSRMMKELGFNWPCTSYYDEELKSIESTLDGYCEYNEVSNDEVDGLLAIPSTHQSVDWIKDTFSIDILSDIDIEERKFFVKIYKNFNLIAKSDSVFDNSISALNCGVNSVVKFIYEKEDIESDIIRFVY